MVKNQKKNNTVSKTRSNTGDQSLLFRLAMTAAMADNPAVMTASGWHKDDRGNFYQKRTPATDELAENLGTLSMFASGDPVLPTAKALWFALRHPVLTAKGVVNTVKLIKNAITSSKVAKKTTLATRRVYKTLNAPKRVKRVQKAIEKERSVLKELGEQIDLKRDMLNKQESSPYRPSFSEIYGKLRARRQALNWERMTKEQAEKASVSVKKPTKFSTRKAKVKTKNGIEERDVPVIVDGLSSSDSVTLGKYETPDFLTGNTVVGDLKIDGSGQVLYPPTVTPVLEDAANDVVPRAISGDVELRRVLRDNIEYLKKEIPGFKPFGSSVGVSENAITHNTHDIDGYITREVLKQLEKKGLVSPTVNGETYLYKVQNGKFGGAGNVDLNILNVGEDGVIGNARTAEMYRQFFPVEYQQQIRRLAANSKGNVIGRLKALDSEGNIITEQQLLDSYDPLVKTILDSGEINFTNPNKAKHAGRFLEYLAGDNPEAVHRALELESKRAGSLGHLLPKMNFYSPEENVKILQKIGFEGDLYTIASDPNKMQNVLDYWYLSARRNFRSVGPGNIDGTERSVKNIMRNLTDWNPDKSTNGGTAFGLGLNSTIDGPSGIGGMINGYLLPYIEGLDNMTDPYEVIEAVNRSNGIGLSDAVKQEIAKRFGISFTPSRVNGSEDLLGALPSSGYETKQIMQGVSQDYGINALAGSPYNEKALYSGITRTLDPNKDAIGTVLSPQYGYLGGVPEYPSWTARMARMSQGRSGWDLPNGRYVQPTINFYDDPLYALRKKWIQDAREVRRRLNGLPSKERALTEMRGRIDDNIWKAVSISAPTGILLGGGSWIGHLIKKGKDRSKIKDEAQKLNDALYDYASSLNDALQYQYTHLKRPYNPDESMPYVKRSIGNYSYDLMLKGYDEETNSFLNLNMKPLRNPYLSTSVSE